LAPPNPAAQRLGRTADLLCDRLDRRPFRFILVRVLADQPSRTLPHLRRVLLCSCNGSNFSSDGASGKLGAIQVISGAALGVSSAPSSRGTTRTPLLIPLYINLNIGMLRSEERRVGKDRIVRGSASR